MHHYFIKYYHNTIMSPEKFFLGEVGNDQSLRLIFDSMRLDEDFYDDYLGDGAGNAYIPTWPS